MERPTATTFRVGEWCVNPIAGEISRDGETARVEARTMRLLACLAERCGEVVSIDDLLTEVWPDVTVTPDSVYQAVTSLRRLLGDDPKQPTYIATVPRLGYRMVAPVSLSPDPLRSEPIAQGVSPQTLNNDHRMNTGAVKSTSRRSSAFKWAVGAALCIALVAFLAALQFRGKVTNSDQSVAAAATQSEKSIAVLPFLDLTEGMKEEEFADGMTEELIDKLSKIQGLRVPSPTSSFYFKGKQVPVGDIAKTLGVAYVLDGSVRKSGARVRIAARLVRAENGYVAWSETYDRPFGDLLMVQDDIAGEVTKALKASIDASTSR